MCSPCVYTNSEEWSEREMVWEKCTWGQCKLVSVCHGFVHIYLWRSFWLYCCMIFNALLCVCASKFACLLICLFVCLNFNGETHPAHSIEPHRPIKMQTNCVLYFYWQFFFARIHWLTFMHVLLVLKQFRRSALNKWNAFKNINVNSFTKN